jgi:hypothetical protein
MTKHPFMSVDATRVLSTESGTFWVCDDCAEQLAAAGYVYSDRAIECAPGAQQCECEHSDHFDACAAAVQ